MSEDKKLGLWLLVALAIGSMIGGGIFNSPTDLISKANPQAIILAWIVGGAGVLFLALVFQMLANKRQDLTGGIYSYAKEGFGDFIGFNSAWGYWLSAFLGNVAFFTLLFKTVNSLLGKGNELDPKIAFLLASVVLWVIHYLQTRGTKSAGVANALVTVAKLLPLALVILFGVFIFKPSIFSVPNWQSILASASDASAAGTTVMGQIKSAMGTILWAFIGVEAAVVLSDKAKSQRIVGKATIISILITLFIYISISIIATGSVPAKELAGSGTPLADVLSRTMIGQVGGVIVKVGLIISLLGGLISWIMLAAEIAYVAAKDRVMPKWFAKENSAGVPINSLIITNVLTQVFLLALLSERLQTVYNTVFYIATTCILLPYLFSALYALKVCRQDKLSMGQYLIALLATIYAIYVIYAVGLVYLVAAFILYAVGLIAFYIAKRENSEKYKTGEIVATFVVAAIGIYMLIQVIAGKISL